MYFSKYTPVSPYSVPPTFWVVATPLIATMECSKRAIVFICAHLLRIPPIRQNALDAAKNRLARLPLSSLPIHVKQWGSNSEC